MPSPKQDLHQYLHASVKCDTFTRDADGLLSSVMKVNRIVFVCTSKGERMSDTCRCVSLPCWCLRQIGKKGVKQGERRTGMSQGQYLVTLLSR